MNYLDHATRASGILLPISALPAPYGIGTLGRAAREFVDFLHDAHQRWWQILPVGQLSYGDSPYQCPSAYAGNPYFIDLELLMSEGLLRQEEVTKPFWGSAPDRVDYAALYENRYPLLEKATRRGWERDREAVEQFQAENAHWLPDYALFMALKRHFQMKPWTQWPDEAVRCREPEALRRYTEALSGEIQLFTYIQFLFFRQWRAFRKYTHEKGVGIIGDLPIYVALDSADVWAAPEQFLLDAAFCPIEVSGVPPDDFNAGGQLWGNPLYRYEAMEQNGYDWWLRRMKGVRNLYDVVRLDHFRGFESYWAVPYGDQTAARGRWVKGPGMKLVGPLCAAAGPGRLIAEDLGYPTPEVRQLLRDAGLPGMKVLEFAFDSRDETDEKPHTYGRNCVCYTGTHDNPPLMAWKAEANREDVELAVEYFGLHPAEGFHWGMLRGGMGSAAMLFVAQLQDYLALGPESRINAPGTLGGNWQWRLAPGQLTAALAERIARMTRLYGRDSAAANTATGPARNW